MTASGACLPKWSISAVGSRLAGCRRLHRRYEREADQFLALAGIAATLIRYRRMAA